MPTLRLFAQARDAAGVASVEIPGRTVGEVLDAARSRFGEPFASVLAEAKVWCNGEPTSPDAEVADGDEVAVLPPVSGGMDDDGAARIPAATRNRSLSRDDGGVSK